MALLCHVSEKLCCSLAQDSIAFLISRLEQANFPRQLLGSVIRRLLSEAKGLRQDVSERPEGRLTVVPYAHKMPHHLKKLARRYAPQTQSFVFE